MNALVSAIIPVHNYAQYIFEALDSVLKQTYKNIEIIVVDDGSTDDTKAIVGGYIEKYADRIRYFYQENKGPGVARNLGIKQSKGQYIAFLDADDIWLSKKLQLQIDLFEKEPTLGFIHTNHTLFNLKEVVANHKFAVNSKRHLSGEIFPYLLRECIVRTSTAVIKRECISSIGFFETTFSGEDYDFWLRAAKKYKAGYINEPLARCREHIQQTHLGVNKTYTNVKRVIEKTIQSFPEIMEDFECRKSLRYREAKINFELGYSFFKQDMFHFVFLP